MSKKKTAKLLIVALGLAVSAAFVAGIGSPASATTFSSPVQVDGAPGNPSSGIEYAGKLYFSATNTDGHRRLFGFDGSTFSLADGMNSNPQNFVVANGKLFYSATDADGVWHLLSFDGSDWSMEAGQSDYAAIQALPLPGSLDLILAVPQSDVETRLELSSQGNITVVETFAYINDLVAFGDYVYFTGTPSGQSYYQMFRTDGLVAELARPGAGVDMTVWNDNLYLGFMDQNYAFYRMKPDLSLDPAVIPNIEYAYNFTPFGDSLVFTGDTDGPQVLYSFDGQVATPIAGSPSRIDNLTVMGSDLFLTGDNSAVQVCSLEVTPDCAEFGHLYQYDGSGWTRIADTAGYYNSLMSFDGRLYFDEGTRWMMIEPLATLPKTGFDPTIIGSLALVLLFSGLPLTLVRRRKPALTTG